MKKLGRPRKVRSLTNGPIKYQWKPEEIKFLKKNFHSFSNKELASELRITLTMVRMKCYELGLKRMELEYWTPEQIRFLIRSYKKFGDMELAEIFSSKWKKNKGWRNKHIEKKRLYLKLKRTEAEKKRIFLRNKKMGRFKFCPVNRWIMQGVFPEGTIRIWRYSYEKRGGRGGGYFKAIKIGGKFVHYAPWLYEKHFGKMPPGYVTGFKDRDNMNVVIDNLECISRAEHARRNGRSLPEDVREAVKMLNELNNIINQKSSIK